VPLEIKVAGEKEPIYNFTLEDLGRFNEQPTLPFNAYGTLAWARAEFDNDSASSQIFFLLKESELTPSGANLLDGRYAVFGYVTQGQDNLGLLKVGSGGGEDDCGGCGWWVGWWGRACMQTLHPATAPAASHMLMLYIAMQ
jgi:cyclophilin family peptidyl-prolyl cis-trans isomerase